MVVVDTAGPSLACNAPASIRPGARRAAFVASAVDGCAGALAPRVTAFGCTKDVARGGAETKDASCEVVSDGPTLTILNPGSADHVRWTVAAEDASGNAAERACEVRVERAR